MSHAPHMNLAKRMLDWRTEALANPWFFKGFIGGLGVALLDQATKFWIVHRVRLPERGRIEISGVFDLTYVENTGASFGMLAGGIASRIVLSSISIGVFVGLTYWLARLRRPIAVVGVGLIIGGALGNLYDRLAYGFVVDFLDFSGLYFPWVFNVADASINVGIAALLLDAWRTREPKIPRQKP